MFASNVFPITTQCLPTVSLQQIQSASNAVRSAIRSRHSKRINQCTTQLDTDVDQILKDQLPSMFNSLRDEDFLFDLNTLLNPHSSLNQKYVKNKQNKSGENPWKECHLSQDTFFQNKYGFKETQLWWSVYGGEVIQVLPVKKSLLQGLYSRKNSPCEIQTRGFKTHRSRTTSGIGTHKTHENPSVFEKMWNYLSGNHQPRSTTRLTELLGEHQSHPDVKQKLKLAFAEGYAANVDKQPTDNMARRIVKALLMGFILYLLYVTLLKFNVEMKHALKGDVFKISPESTGVSFDDVKGADEAKQELKDIVSFLKDPEKFEAIGAKLPKGILLVGSPGIGKTLLARAVAGEAGVPFFYASGSDFDEMLVGMGAKRVRNLFEAAKSHSPCIIFIDEIDSVGSKRTESNIHPYANQTINQLLSEMDGYSPNEGVIVLGATNRRQTLDKALLRPGRFDTEVHIFPPDMKGRREIFKHYLSKVKVHPSVDSEKLAKGTAGFTGAAIENMVNQAALQAALDGTAQVKLSHLEQARDKIIMGPAKKYRIPDEATNLNTAYHEAGHTLVAYYTEDATPLHKVTIIPRGSSLGHTSFIPDKEQYGLTKSQLLAQMDVSMGGRVAEEIMFGADKVSTGASNDFEQATAIATAMVKKFGMSERVGVRVFDAEMVPTLYGTAVPTSTHTSPATAELLDDEIKRYLHESYERASSILRNHMTELKALSKALIKHDTLDANEIKAIVENKSSL